MTGQCHRQQLYCPVLRNILWMSVAPGLRPVARSDPGKLSQGWSEPKSSNISLTIRDRVLARLQPWTELAGVPGAAGCHCRGRLHPVSRAKAWKQPAPQAASTLPAPEQTDEYVMRLEEE